MKGSYARDGGAYERGKAQGHWYYTEITTMNERRLRHLLAIADTFKVKG